VKGEGSGIDDRLLPRFTRATSEQRFQNSSFDTIHSRASHAVSELNYAVKIPNPTPLKEQGQVYIIGLSAGTV
jgi:hypothetical protein